MLKTIAPNANTVNYLYDNSGNVIQTVNGTEKNTFTYEFDGQLRKQSKYVNDILSEAAEYNYDDLERLTSKVIGSDTTSYAYNTMGSVTSVTSPTGFVTAYTLDKAERITEVEFGGKKIAYEYYGDGLVKKITYPNSMTTEYSYDNANRVSSIVTKLGSKVLRSYSYTYDGNGNVLTVSGSENVTYTYDALNRLASSTKNGVTTVYTYDGRNNLVSETDGTNTKTYEYGGDNRLHKVVENGVETVYEYDLNGNLIQRGEDRFAYDENSRLVYSSVNGFETNYEIGVEGLRRAKTTNGNRTTYRLNENGYVLSENDEDIIYGHNALGKEIDGKYYYYVYNAHGDVTAIVDESGNIENSYEYDPWGEITSQTETVANHIKYAGEYYDEETGLIYLRNRYYDPSVGRFISEDPHWNHNNMIYGDKEYKDGEIKIPDMNAIMQSSNLYAYCINNPVRYEDASGEAIETIADIISIGLSAKDLVANPSWANFGFLAWDVASTILPAIPGSYTYKTAKVVKGVSGLKKFTRYNLRKNLTTLIGDAPKWMGKVEAHHVLPVKFENWFKKRGIESIHDPRFGTWVNKTSHQKWSNEYNKNWSNFIEKNPNASTNKIIEYARTLAEEYGFNLNF